ncbi:Terpenoid cyclases/protein prenyltransferase alpha-alpha toroid [Balamuthia mandrillaris]
MEVPLVSEERLRVSLWSMWQWTKDMVDPSSHRLYYEFDPVHDLGRLSDQCPIRDIGAIYQTALLGSYLQTQELNPLIRSWIDRYVPSFVVPSEKPRQGKEAEEEEEPPLQLDAERLGEPASIAHSAFMILSLLTFKEEAETGERRRKAEGERRRRREREIAVGLANGIVKQQRRDGSYKVFFEEGMPDGSAVLLYPGEAMLALMATYEATKDEKYLRSVQRAHPFYSSLFLQGKVPSDHLIFFANWFSQSSAPLFQHLPTLKDGQEEREEVKRVVVKLFDHIVERVGYFERVSQAPSEMATVEVACALEGLADAYFVLCSPSGEEAREKEEERRRKEKWKRSCGIAIHFLLMVQRKEDKAEKGGKNAKKKRGAGGFGHMLQYPKQRVDVTGHVLSGFIKVIEHRVFA